MTGAQQQTYVRDYLETVWHIARAGDDRAARCSAVASGHTWSQATTGPVEYVCADCLTAAGYIPVPA